MAFVVHQWRLLNLKLELPFQTHIVWHCESLNEISTCSRSGCLSVTNALNKSTSCTFERSYRVVESSGEEESLFRGLPSSRNRLRFWALALSLGSLSGVINTPSTSLPLLLLESSSELMFSSVSVEDWTNLCKEACLAVRFLRKLGASKETKMSLSGELSWPFSEEIEVRFVISFITDIIRRQNATNFGGNEKKDPSNQRSNMRMNAKTENKANLRAKEPSVMIGRSQPRFHKVKLEWNDREKGKGKRFAQNCAVSLRETIASEANGFLVCSSFVFQKVEVSLCLCLSRPLPLSFSSWLSFSLFTRACLLLLYGLQTKNTREKPPVTQSRETKE